MPIQNNKLAVSLLVVICLTAGAGAGFVRWLQKGLPPLERLERIEPPIKTLFFAAGGDTLAEFYEYNRVLVPLERIPEPLVGAVLAMEDRKFYGHWGVDLRSVLRAGIRNVRAGRVVEGASTITQQLARNLFIHEESGWMAQTYTRKIREALLAMEIEKRYTKSEILEMYLNHIFLGQRAYGMEAAARTYLGKHVEELDLAECALLAGIIQNPIEYPPNKNPELALRRRSVVLNVMVDRGLITREEADSAASKPLELATGSPRKFESGYFVEHVRKFVESRFPPEEYMLRGLRVHTTLDLEAQRTAEKAVEDHLARVEKERRYPQTRADYLEAGGKGKPEYIQGALLALEPETGYIRAMVGGRNYEESNWNRATQAPRQPGSAFKLFVFTAALADGYRPSDMVLDSPVVLPEADGTSWRPHNYYRRYNGLVSLRTAFEKSINLPAVKLCLAVGTEKIVETAHRLGIRSPIQPVPSIALGSPEVNLLELTSAYSVFRNGGILVEPAAVLRIEDRNGKVLYERERSAEEVIPAALASVMTSLMEGVCDWNGTGVRLRQTGWKGPAAGKTGTYDNYTNAWFIGFTPETITGVWVGFEEKINMGTNMNGAVAAQPIWIDFVTAVSDSVKTGSFPLADGVVRRRICPETGFLASSLCPGAYEEVFLEGTEPQTPCNRHGRIASRPIVDFGGSR